MDMQEYHKKRYIEMLPDNIFYDSCIECGEIWWEGRLKECICKMFKICDMCEPTSGHNFTKCEEEDPSDTDSEECYNCDNNDQLKFCACKRHKVCESCQPISRHNFTSCDKSEKQATI